jgi:hypothetical protein
LRRRILFSLLVIIFLLAGLSPSLKSAAAGDPKLIEFSGYRWQVKGGTSLEPGHNNWSDANAWVDSSGYLHLKITRTPQGWQCAEIISQDNFGFGKYEFYLIGQIDQLDPHVVLGLFNYPAADASSDGTFETDIEISRWGNAQNPNGNLTIWPLNPELQQGSQTFNFTLNGTYTTQRFTWASDQIYFQSLHGHRTDNNYQITDWLYKPDDPQSYIPQNPMPVHINLWLSGGQPPSSEVEIIIAKFSYTPG